MLLYNCISCGREMDAADDATLAVCPCCGVRQPVPVGLNKDAMELYGEATEALREGDSFVALQLAERILMLFPDCACVYWLAVLAEYGVEYIRTHSKDIPMPGSGFLSICSVFSNMHFAAALQCADEELTVFLEENAAAIETQQKRMLDAALHAQNYDVFISCETGYGVRRTVDYKTAEGLYRRIRKSGLRVFLRGESGATDEPSVFAALHSAKVMLVIGSDAASFCGQNVEGDWRRFLGLRKKGDRKLLLPLYTNMNPKDLPQDLAALSPRRYGEQGILAGVVNDALAFCRRPAHDKTLRTRADVLAAGEVVRQFDLAAQKRGNEEQRSQMFGSLLADEKKAENEEDYRRLAAGYRRLSGYRNAEERADACLRAAERLHYEPLRKTEAERLLRAGKKRAAMPAEEKHFGSGSSHGLHTATFLSSFVLFLAAAAAVVLLLVYAVLPLVDYAGAGRKLKKGMLEEARAIYTELGDFLDSREKIIEMEEASFFTSFLPPD